MVDIDSDQITTTCVACGWHYTYRAIPKRLLCAFDELTLLIKQLAKGKEGVNERNSHRDLE